MFMWSSWFFRQEFTVHWQSWVICHVSWCWHRQLLADCYVCWNELWTVLLSRWHCVRMARAVTTPSKLVPWSWPTRVAVVLMSLTRWAVSIKLCLKPWYSCLMHIHCHCYWHCPHSTQSGVYVTVWCLSICLSQYGPTAAKPLRSSGRRMRAVPHCQPTWIAEHTLVLCE